MVTLGSLMIAMALSAVIVFMASALVWMVLPHHRTDFRQLPNEEAARAALGAQKAAPGQYTIPYAMGSAAMKDPAWIKRFEEGPVAIVTVKPMGRPAMGPMLVQTFIFYLAVGLVVAYLASRTLPHGAAYLSVFRVVGTTTWLAHGFAAFHESIWFGKPWSSTVKHLGDSLLYALLTAGTFAWLWPR
jgi:hypothetical protein